jgi:cytochrome c5
MNSESKRQIKMNHVVVTTAVVCCASIVLSRERVLARQVADIPQVTRDLPSGEGVGTVRAICTTCHGSELIAQQRLSRDAWSREIDKMAAWGASVTSGERDVLLTYLSSSVGIASSEPPANATAGAALLQARCQTCHDRTLIEQQRLDAAGWARELDKMIGWGAVLDDAEKAAVIDYLARRRTL